MGLTLVAGPANAGKVALLLERYLGALDREPVLIVPTRSDVERVERELLALRPALLGGAIALAASPFLPPGVPVLLALLGLVIVLRRKERVVPT
jgi:hypothetical protein